MTDQRLSVVTLGADDLQAMRTFYTEKFGWKIEAENKDIIFFKMGGSLFSLFGRKDLAAFNGVPAEGSGFRPVNLAVLYPNREMVEAKYEEMLKKGVTILKGPTEPSFGGLIFLVKDIEGNAWEFGYNPLILQNKEGDVTEHKSIDHL